MEKSRISLRNLEDAYKKVYGSENVRVKLFVDKDDKFYRDEELKVLMEKD